MELFTMNTCKNPACKKEFEAGKGIGGYCSRKCYNKGYYSSLKGLREQAKNQPTVKTKTEEEKPVIEKPDTSAYSLSGLGQLPPAAGFIIKELERSRDKLEKEYEAERTRRKSAQEEVAKLKEQIRKLETDAQIAESAKPSGLGALLDSGIVKEFIPHLAPVIADFVKNGIKPTAAAGPQMAGMEEGTQQMAMQIVNWFAAQPGDLQKNFYILLDELAKDNRKPEETQEYVQQFYNLLTYQPNMKANAGY